MFVHSTFLVVDFVCMFLHQFQKCLVSLANVAVVTLGHVNSNTMLDLFCLGTLSFAFVNKFNLVVRLSR